MRPEKQLLLDEINDKIDQSNSIILMRYDRLTPQGSWDLALTLNKSKSSFTAVKKRLLYKAAKEKDLPFKDETFDGHLGLVCIEGDSLEATKAIVKFYEDSKGLLEIITGQIDGKACSVDQIVTLSKLPSKDEMRAQLLGLLEAPMSQTLSAIESLISSVMHCLENKKNKEN